MGNQEFMHHRFPTSIIVPDMWMLNNCLMKEGKKGRREGGKERDRGKVWRMGMNGKNVNVLFRNNMMIT